MKKHFDDYQLLHNGRRSGSLWLGHDHLLVIEKFSFFLAIKENYRRLDYDSIQGIFTAPSKAGRVTTIIVSTGIALFLLTGLLARENMRPFAITMLVFAGVLGACLLVHLLRGPTAGIIIRTAVKPWKLAQVRRLSQANKVMDALAERCAQAQGGTLPAGALDIPAVAGPGGIPSARPEGAAPASLAGPPPPPLPFRGNAWDATEPPHPTTPWAYLSLAAFSLMLGGELAIDALAYTLAMLATGATAFVMLFVAMARRGGLARTGSPAAWISSVVFLAVTGLSAYVLAMVGLVALQMQNLGDDHVLAQLDMIKVIARFPTGSPEPVKIFAMVLAVGCLASALAGLLAWQRRRTQLQIVPVTA